MGSVTKGMERKQNNIFSALLCLFSVLCCTGPFSVTGDLLPSPNNVTLRFENMFSLRWEWEMPANFQKCSWSFISDVKTNRKPPPGMVKSSNLFRQVDIHRVDLNNQITFNVQAECNGTSSKWSENSVLIIPGNNTCVKNFACFWFDETYMNCTWEPTVDSVRATEYVLHYWRKNGSSTSEGKINRSVKFDQLWYSGTPCQHYIYKDGIPLGCHFKTVSEKNLFLMVIRDKSKTIRPFITSVKPEEVVKLSPPVIINKTRTPNHSIYVEWSTSFQPSCLHINSEIEITSSKGKVETVEVPKCTFTRELNALPELTYTVRVRVRQSSTISSSLFWSEWSEAHDIKGTEDNTTFYFLLILIPISVSIVTIVILVFLKRLQVIVFPPIPDPGKVFKKSFGDPSDLQQWIKYGKVNVSSKPVKEEICSVILVETPLFSSQAE
ncbi:hypothetical protein XENTR_v10021083 [Xenopus tropicalis]|uniref:Interleukin-13 receptor subunit alpha-1 n=1 Tax=Xenopus tropicalis TaxID=8364 RepID=A0A6I8Q1N5_XENTR|nr:interleukin-13 receptor subunit alpha-1 [Xenopus tropicalis]KAE8584721.1 hypothetical protein XENTR_v10021083 [Xenopus tropicalis]